MKLAPLDLADFDQSTIELTSGLELTAGATEAALPFASALFASEHQLREIRKALETLLREGEADDVIDRLDAAIAALAELGHPIASLCRATQLEDVSIIGWSDLGERLARLDASGPRITAIGINISSKGHGHIDDEGRANPCLETVFYADNAFGFSTASRTALLTGYTECGNEWQDGFVEIDETLSCSGLGALQTAVARLGADLRRAPSGSGADHDALFIGSAFLATRIHQAVREAVLNAGLPRPLTILVGSNGSAPFFDAPVITAGEYSRFAPQLALSIAPEPEPIEEPAAEIDSEIIGEDAEEITKAFPPLPIESLGAPAIAPEPARQSGNSLRRSVMARSNETELPAPTPAASRDASPSLLGRLFRRK